MKEAKDTSVGDPVQLTARSVSLRMSELLKGFSSSTVYHQWNVTVDRVVGEYGKVHVRTPKCKLDTQHGYIYGECTWFMYSHAFFQIVH